MSDSSEPMESTQPLPAVGSELPVGQGILGTDGIQRAADSFQASVTKLGGELDNLAGKLTGFGQGSGAVSSGAAAGAQNRGTGATGSSGGGYASMIRRFSTFGQQAGGGSVGTGGTGGGRTGGGFSTFGSGSGANGSTGALRGAVATGLDAVAAAGAYGNAHINSFMTMNTAATNAMWRSGLAAGGVNASLGTATRMIFGTAGGFQNVTAASVGDAAGANGLLGYTAGIGMYGSNGAPNSQYQAAQANMFALGYANPTMSQTQIASSMQSIYSPNSIRAMTAMGVKLPSGFVGPQNTSPMAVAQSVFSRTFGGASSVNAATMTAATGQGGSLNANLTYLGQQAGWSSGTVSALQTYLQQRNNAIQAGLPAGQVDSLLQQASTGSKQAASTLAQYGIGSSTVQSVKTLQASQTSNLADQSGGFNDALQQSTSLLTDFNQVLGQILQSTGLSGGIGSLSGYGSMFGNVAGAAGYMAGSGGSGGMGFVGGSGGGLGGVGMNLGMNYAMGRASRYGSQMLGKAGSALRSKFGRSAASTAAEASQEGTAAASAAEGTVAAGTGEAAAVTAAGAGGTSLGLGLLGGAALMYGGVNGNNALWNKYGDNGTSGFHWQDAAKIGGNTLSYAAGGALMGSVLGPLGAAVGGGIGALWGLGQGILDWHHDESGYAAANTPGSAGTAALSLGGYSSGLGNGGTGSIGGGTDEGVTGTARPSSVTPAPGAGNAGAATLQKVIAFALAQVGKPYVYAATGPDSYDCSGLMMASYAAGGIKLPRTSEQQMTSGSPVKPDAALPGDLMFPYPGHVMMCIGGGQVVEARHTGTVIWVRKYSPGEFIASRRIVSVGASAGLNDAASGGNAATGGNTNDAMGAGIASASGAGISELQAIQQNAQSATTDRLTASLRITAANTPFGAASLSASLNSDNPFANTGGAGAAGPSGSTALTGTVRDKYGHTYKIPTGTKPSGSVSSWINSALSVMGMAQSPDTVGDIKDIITGESGGDPWSINLYDSNAAAGHPSEGIMQTIPSTFSAYAMGGHKDIWNPVDNIIAGTRYAVANYKSLDNVPGVKAVKSGKPYVGYAAGAWELADDQVAALHKGEMVLPKSAAQSVRNAVISDALGASSTKAQSGATVALNFRAGSIQVTIGGPVTAATAQQAATAIVDGIAADPRIKAMAVGL